MKYDMTFPFASFTSDVVVPDEYADFLADPDNGLKGSSPTGRTRRSRSMVQTFESTTDESRARAEVAEDPAGADGRRRRSINVMNLPFVNAHTATTCGTAIDALGSDHLEDTWLAKGKADDS